MSDKRGNNGSKVVIHRVHQSTQASPAVTDRKPANNCRAVRQFGPNLPVRQTQDYPSIAFRKCMFITTTIMLDERKNGDPNQTSITQKNETTVEVQATTNPTRRIHSHLTKQQTKTRQSKGLSQVPGLGTKILVCSRRTIANTIFT